SKVYSASARVPDYQTWWLPRESMLRKMERVFYACKLDGLCAGEVALKIHMGEPGDTHYIRPAFAGALAGLIKKEGGNPTVIETSGMGWIAGRTSEKRHLDAARRNGFTEETIGAGIRMIDGELGLDTIPGSVVARGISDFDSMIVLSHVTGHVQAGFGGAIKNVGLGCVTKSGKYRVHHSVPPKIDLEKCTCCDECIKICPSDAVKDYIITKECSLCSLCLDVCESCAISAAFRGKISLTEMIADNASEVLRHMDSTGFINLAIDVLPHCDCHPFSDVPLVPDIGVLASRDPIAVDRASIDLVNSSPGSPGSSAEDHRAAAEGIDKFNAVNPKTSWKAQLKRAEELGIGSQRYTLENVR
ncbi:MAG: DUF362 domain-containing protein, partial [Candidatus Hydrothermarchaeales archaeon]